MTNRWNEKQVFLEALALAAIERDAYLRRACPNDDARLRIETLLRHHVVTHETVGAPPAFPAGDDNSLPPGCLLDEFRIVRTIDRGGMGVVYEAEDLVLGRHVALKVLNPQLARSKEARERFEREARAAALLKHPGIVTVYRSGTCANGTYIASEYVEGETLAQFIEREKAKTSIATRDYRSWCIRIAQLLEQVADALDYAHRHGVVHRDVKPSNILVDKDGQARLTDFGIAKYLPDPAVTRPTDLLGSCHYMSPEQVVHATTPIDGRSDVFSLGVVLYEALACRPFDGADVRQVLKAVLEHEPPRLRSVSRYIPRPLEIICEGALKKKPDERYGTAAHFGADLRCFVNNVPFFERRSSVTHRAIALFRRHRRAVYVALVVVLTTAAITAYGLLVHERRAACGQIRVDGAFKGATVAVRRRAYGARPEGQVRVLGTAPLSAYVDPGLYRVAITMPDGSRIETATLATRGSIDHLTQAPAGSNAASGFVRIPGGEYELGAPPGDFNDQPLMRARKVKLAVFEIASSEVSNAEFLEYVLATGAPAPRCWASATDAAHPDLPVTGISWDEANSYCRWRGVRLPTHDEWEAAARGHDLRTFAWGNTERPGWVIADPSDDQSGYLSVAKAVGDDDPAYLSPYKLKHTCSNVQEYVDDVAEADGNMAVAMAGRSWRQSSRFCVWKIATLPERRLWSWDRGFRVARSIKE